MPDRDYTIQDRYGRRLVYTGDHEPTAAEQAQAFADAEQAGMLAGVSKRVPLGSSMFGSTGGPSYNPDDPQENLRTAAREAPMVIGAMTAPLTAGASLGPAMVAQGAIGGGSRMASNVVSGRPPTEGVLRDAIVNAAFEGAGNAAAEQLAPWLMKTGLRIWEPMRARFGSDRIAKLALQMGIIRGEAGETAARGAVSQAERAQQRLLETGTPVQVGKMPEHARRATPPSIGEQVREDIAPALAAQRGAGAAFEEPKILTQFEAQIPTQPGFRTRPAHGAQIGQTARTAPRPATASSAAQPGGARYSPIKVEPADLPIPRPATELDASRRLWSEMSPATAAEREALNALQRRTGDALEAANPGYYAGIEDIALKDALRKAITGTVGKDVTEADRALLPLLFSGHPAAAAATAALRMPAAKRGIAVALDRGAVPGAAAIRTAIMSQLGSSEPGGETLPDRVAGLPAAAKEWAGRSQPVSPPRPITPGNIDLTNRPQVKNADGSTSTIRSISINEDGKEILIPTVSDDGRVLSNQDAIDLYHRTGKHLGTFASPAEADRFGAMLHDQEQQKLDRAAPSSRLLDRSVVGRVLSELPPTPAGGSSQVFTPDPEAAATFNAKLARVRQRMADAGYPMQITSRTRTEQQQNKLYAQGRSAPGQIVTNADGTVNRSPHQTGTAADLVFIVNGQPSYSDKLPWNLLGKIAKEEGLEWGGDWKDLIDRPHVQLPGKTTAPASPTELHLTIGGKR